MPKFCLPILIQLLLTPLLLLGLSSPISASETVYHNYWPMELGNWWRYRQVQSTNNCPPEARMAWWVQPPDLSIRGLASRVLETRKTHDCIWNWVNDPISIRWHISYPQYFPTAEGTPIHWFRQWGVIRYPLNDDSINPSSIIYNLPFNKDIPSTFHHVSLPAVFAPDSWLHPRKSTRQNYLGSPTDQQPYGIVPLASLANQTLTDIDRFYSTCPGEISFQSLRHQDETACQQFAGQTGQTINDNRYSWYSTIEQIMLSTSDIPVFPPEQQFVNANKIHFYEVGYKDQDTGSVDDVAWVACENWYVVNGIGPVKIDATHFPADSIPSNFSSFEQLKSTCADFDFDAYLSGNQPKPNYAREVTRVALEQYSINQSDSPYGYDSPQAVSKFLNNQLMYLHRGRWWSYNLETGILESTGLLQDVWGPGGSNAPSVTVNGQVRFPYSLSNKLALAWSPEFIQNILGKSPGKQIIFNNGAYWILDPSAGNWIDSGLTSNLMTNAPGYNLNGQTIYPYTNGGPQAADETQNPNELAIINQGIVWAWNANGFSNPVKLENVPNYSNAPERYGVKPFNPQAMVQFKDGQLLNQSTVFGPLNQGQELSPIPNNDQSVIFQDGLVWINFHNGQWQQYNDPSHTPLPAPSITTYSKLINAFGQQGTHPEDINNDNRVNIFDLNLFAHSQT